MNDNSREINGLTRRDFIRVGATGAMGVALSGLGELPVSAAETPGLLPRRRYGRTGLGDQHAGGGGRLESRLDPAGGQVRGELLAQGA